MCEFCENIPTRYGDTEECKTDMLSDSLAHLFYIYKNGNRFFLTKCRESGDNFKINYCPLCGRKLD